MKYIIVTLFGIVIALSLWAYDQFSYQTLGEFKCDAKREFLIPTSNLIPADMLELYVGGWIDRGTVTILGLPSRENEPLEFRRGDNVVGTISHAYIGEWYEAVTKIIFLPSDDASCLIRVIYKYN